MNQLVSNPNHRQEVVAGNLAQFLKDGEWIVSSCTRTRHVILPVAYNRAHAHVNGNCASYHEIMMQEQMSGIKNLVSSILLNSAGEVTEVSDSPPARITRANRHVDR